MEKRKQLNNDQYAIWRDEKLANYRPPESLFVEISNPLKLSSVEKKTISNNCRSNNLSLIKIKPAADIRITLQSINAQLGLVDFDQHLCVEDDNFAIIQDNNASKKGGYVPYSNKALNWHTDGYYNQMHDLVGAFSLYCINPAIEGGENNWIDPEMLYIHLRELNLDIINALSQPATLTIPERKNDNTIIRAASTGPVFWLNKASQKPSMRYTQRKKNIHWLQSSEVNDALCVLNDFLVGDSDIHHQYKLDAGEGLICNNVVHNRTAFVDSNHQKRVLLRARYKNRVLSF